jgi:hypothetical protein
MHGGENAEVFMLNCVQGFIPPWWGRSWTHNVEVQRAADAAACTYAGCFG